MENTHHDMIQILSDGRDLYETILFENFQVINQHTIKGPTDLKGEAGPRKLISWLG